RRSRQHELRLQLRGWQRQQRLVARGRRTRRPELPLRQLISCPGLGPGPSQARIVVGSALKAGTRAPVPPQEGSAPMPKIRHLAIVCMDPDQLAKFYCEVFDMKVVGRNGRSNVFVSDGYITVALLSQKAEGKPCGLN